MSRTPIPDRLVHRPEEVERNARHFDQLCRLGEEIALPVVKQVLVRETSATAADAVTSEAKLALEELLNDPVLKELEEPGVLDKVRKSLEGAVPPPDETECKALARDVAQVLMGTWVEVLRAELSGTLSLVLDLSDQLLPLAVSRALKQSVLTPLSDALGSLGLNESETGDMMKSLRIRLFSKPRLVELPFELVIAGAPESPVLAMTEATRYDLLENARKRAQQQQVNLEEDWGPATATHKMPEFVTPAAKVAVASLSSYLSPGFYTCLKRRAGKANEYSRQVAGG